MNLRKKTGLSLILSTSLMSIAIPSSAFTVTTTKLDFLGRASGHEELTRQAAKHTNEFFEMTEEFDVDEVFGDEGLGGLKASAFGKRGFGTSNLIIQGNYATDAPIKSKHGDTEDQWPVDLKQFHNVNENTSWHDNPNGQVIHFLRNVVLPIGNSITPSGEGRYQSAQEACNESSELILKATEKAVQLWGHLTNIDKKILTPSLLAQNHPEEFGYMVQLSRRKAVRSLREKALFLLGHATHIIQDSFSPAHTQRNSQTGKLEDVCRYKDLSISGILGSVPHAITTVAQMAYVPGAVALNTEIMHQARVKRREQGLICKHQTYDYGDSVWIRNNRQYATALEFDWEDLESKIWQNLEEKKRLWQKAINVGGRIISKPGEVLLDSKLGGFTGKLGKALLTDMNNLVRTDLAIKICIKNFFNTEVQKHMCLNHEGRLARSATMKYLIAVSRHLYKQQILVEKKSPETSFNGNWQELEDTLIDNVFNGNQNITHFHLKDIMPDGIFQCQSLNN